MFPVRFKLKFYILFGRNRLYKVNDSLRKCSSHLQAWNAVCVGLVPRTYVDELQTSRGWGVCETF
jgi:hypothetical protein